MSDNSGSYMRFTSDHHFPSSRPHNTQLANVVVKKSELEGNVAERGLSMRPPNPNAKMYEYKRTMYDREINNNVVGGSIFLGGVGNPMGGAVSNPGWDPRHPRLSRNPNWYEGRGKKRAAAVGSVLGEIALSAL